MRFTGSLFLQQAVARGGAQLEGDGEITLPPVIQPVVEVPFPLNVVTSSGRQDRTFVSSLSVNQIGVDTGGQLDDVRTFGPGLWHVTGNSAHQFTGTLQSGTFGVYLRDPGGVKRDMVPHVMAAAASAGQQTFNFYFSLTDPGWLIGIVTVPTVLGDVFRMSAAYFANKLS